MDSNLGDMGRTTTTAAPRRLESFRLCFMGVVVGGAILIAVSAKGASEFESQQLQRVIDNLGVPVKDTSRFESSVFEPFQFLVAGDPQIGFSGSIEADRDRFILLGQRAAEWKVPLVLVLGDFVHDVRDNREHGQNQAFDEALSTFTVPAMLVPGNHDMGTGRHAYRERFGYDHYRFVYSNTLFVAVNSQLLKRPHAYGPHPETQWKWLKNTLATSTYDHTFVFMHHPPFVSDENESEHPENLPKDTRDRLMALLREAEIDALLVGHYHRNAVLSVSDGAFPIVISAGTAVDFNGHELGYRIFNVSDSGFTQDFFTLSEPIISAFQAGDVNGDGVADNLDITPFIAALAANNEAGFLDQWSEGRYFAADVDMSGRPNNLDITPFLGLLAETVNDVTTVPEPASIICIVLVVMVGRSWTTKR